MTNDILHNQIALQGQKIVGIVLLCFLLCLNSCIKDDVIEDRFFADYICNPIPQWSGVGLGYVYKTENPQFVEPSFNPNNNDEFIYVRLDFNIGVQEIYKFNIITQSNELIFSGELMSSPQWGSKDWVLFQRPDQNVWKMKSNGDSLTQLSFNGNCFNPKWNSSAELIIYQSSFGTNTAVIMNAEGLILDTLENNSVGAKTSWNHPQYVGGVGGSRVLFFDPLEDSDPIILYEFITPETRRGSIWVNDNIYYSEFAGIQKIGIDDDNPTLVRSGCSAIKYLFPTVNQSKSKLLWTRIDETLLHEDTVGVKTRIVIMDIDGNNEQEITLP